MEVFEIRHVRNAFASCAGRPQSVRSRGGGSGGRGGDHGGDENSGVAPGVARPGFWMWVPSFVSGRRPSAATALLTSSGTRAARTHTSVLSGTQTCSVPCSAITNAPSRTRGRAGQPAVPRTAPGVPLGARQVACALTTVQLHLQHCRRQQARRPRILYGSVTIPVCAQRAFRNCEGYRTAVFTVLRVKTSAHKGGPISRPATPTPSGHLLGTPWAPQDH